MGIEGVTWSYKALQGVTGGYKGLQGVKRPYSGLQINFFITRTSPETFSWFIFYNTSSLNFLTKTMDLPLWKKANFAFFINRCSYTVNPLLSPPGGLFFSSTFEAVVLKGFFSIHNVSKHSFLIYVS